MDRLHCMRVFVSVAEHRSFAEAARELRMSRPAVTRAIAALEDSLGVRLLVRTTRVVAPSEEGSRYLEDCRDILARVAEADAVASGSFTLARGHLRLTAPVMFGRLHVLPVLQGFLEAHPEVSVSALLLDRVVNLVDEGIDVGVRIGHLRDGSYVATRVGEVRPVLVCSPEYAERHGAPDTPQDLAAHTLIWRERESEASNWTFGGARLDLEPRVRVNDARAAMEMATMGVGIARLLSYQAGAGLARGELVRVLEEHEPAPFPVQLVRPAGDRVSGRARAFVDAAAEALRARAARGWA